jgi:hypothetical protein
MRARWFIAGFLLIAAIAGGFLSARGPFDAHPALTYEQFLAEFQAGHVGQITQWGDQLQVTDDGQLRSVAVPPDRDLWADIGAARFAGGVGVNYEGVPDAWLVPTTPFVPTALGIAALLIWVTAIKQGHTQVRVTSVASPR